MGLTSRLVTLGMLVGGSLWAQDAVGTWQGTLKTPARDFRLVLQITRGADEKLGGQAFSIDVSGGAPIPMSGVVQQGAGLKWRIDAIGASFEGALSSDGNAIQGALQGATPAPLTLARATPQTAWTIPAPPVPAKAMDPAAEPVFEVATIKPSSPDGRLRGFTMRGDQVITVNTTVSDILAMAYNPHERQIAGGPAWMASEKFDIAGKPDVAGQPSVAQIKKMLQRLLAERFQLTMHREKRELAVYAITLPAGGRHKLTPNSSGGVLPSLPMPRPGLFPARNATLDDLAQSMQGVVFDRPVVNQTGIAGRYDFTLDWTPDEFQFTGLGPLPAQAETGKPDIYKAFQEQLGLKIEATRAPADVLVIDRLERPSEN